MTSPLPIDVTVPLGSHKPSQDVTPMRTNFNNIDDYLERDHVAPVSEGAGFHQQVTYWEENPPIAPGQPGSPTVGDVTMAFTAPGFVEPTIPQHYWQNSQCITALSAVRGFVKFQHVINNPPPAIPFGGLAVTPIQNFNVVTVKKLTGTTYQVVFKNNTWDTTDNSPLIILHANPLVIGTPIALQYTVMGANTIVITLQTNFSLAFDINMLVMEI